MKALRQRKTIHLSRSLDHYCHQRASNEELQARVQDQVLTRFMTRQISGANTSPTPGKTDILNNFGIICSNLARTLISLIPRSRDPVRSKESIMEDQKRGPSTAKTVEETEMLDDGLPTTKGTDSSLRILIVPQLWLWKFDSECKSPRVKLGHKMRYSDSWFFADLVITSFPERWDRTYQRNSLTNVIRERVEYLNVDREVEPNRLVTEILIACAEFQPTLNVGEHGFTWADAFDDEILSVVSQAIPDSSQPRSDVTFRSIPGSILLC